ncbi:MAG: hypothetical protein NC177_05105 [Ruminococcus flavefaciens]|nr:hypothetical protein [Ruminococcus flavefaciens]
MKKSKRTLCSLMAALTLFTGTAFAPEISSYIKTEPVSIVQSVDANAASGRLYNQNDSKWKNVKFTKYSTSQNSMYESGCGIFSFCNALYALNGTKADAQEVAQWAVNNGSYRPGSGGLSRDTFYNNVQNAFGSRFRFKLSGKYYGNVKDNRLINHLSNGGVAVIHVYNHFMAITGYSNGNYHVIESAVYSGRGLSADSWVSASKLSSGKTNVDWYVLISNASSSPTPSQSQSNVSYFPKYTGKSGSIVEALKAVGVDSSFNNRKNIASKNGISNYSGTANQNTTLLNLLKQGKLKKSGSATTTSTVNYFKKYTGKSGSIVEALKAVGADSSFNYRKSIASKNGINNYSGTASQNSTLLNLLKNGKLIKP